MLYVHNIENVRQHTYILYINMKEIIPDTFVNLLLILNKITSRRIITVERNLIIQYVCAR